MEFRSPWVLLKLMHWSPQLEAPGAAVWSHIEKHKGDSIHRIEKVWKGSGSSSVLRFQPYVWAVFQDPRGLNTWGRGLRIWVGKPNISGWAIERWWPADKFQFYSKLSLFTSTFPKNVQFLSNMEHFWWVNCYPPKIFLSFPEWHHGLVPYEGGGEGCIFGWQKQTPWGDLFLAPEKGRYLDNPRPGGVDIQEWSVGKGGGVMLWCLRTAGLWKWCS